MQCHLCDAQAIISQPPRCQNHFIETFEQHVHETIQRFQLLKKGEKICVAASGGKDSLALLEILHKEYQVEALCVDEGIAGYRDSTIQDLKGFCNERKIPLKIVTFSDVGGKSLDELKPSHPCSTCGVLRRKALLEYSSAYEIIATGHNLDDECQSILMNLLRNNEELMKRIGPKTPKNEGIAQRVKPFYLTPEREVRAYCIVKGITSNFAECPNIVKSFRWQVGESLNELENTQPGSKRNIAETFLKDHYWDRQNTST